jgi:hypothetical protein
MAKLYNWKDFRVSGSTDHAPLTTYMHHFISGTKIPYSLLNAHQITSPFHMPNKPITYYHYTYPDTTSKWHNLPTPIWNHTWLIHLTLTFSHLNLTFTFYSLTQFLRLNCTWPFMLTPSSPLLCRQHIPMINSSLGTMQRYSIKKSCVAFCAYKNQIQNKNIPWQVTKKNQNETSFPATFSFN